MQRLVIRDTGYRDGGENFGGKKKVLLTARTWGKGSTAAKKAINDTEGSGL